MKKLMQKYFNLQEQQTNLELQLSEIKLNLLTDVVKSRISNINDKIHSAEHDILKKLNHNVTCYDVLFQSGYDHIDISSMSEDDFIAVLSYYDRENEHFIWFVKIPFDAAKDQEYIDKQIQFVKDHWIQIVETVKKADIEYNTKQIAIMQKQIETLKQKMKE